MQLVHGNKEKVLEVGGGEVEKKAKSRNVTLSLSKPTVRIQN